MRCWERKDFSLFTDVWMGVSLAYFVSLVKVFGVGEGARQCQYPRRSEQRRV